MIARVVRRGELTIPAALVEAAGAGGCRACRVVARGDRIYFFPDAAGPVMLSRPNAGALTRRVSLSRQTGLRLDPGTELKAAIDRAGILERPEVDGHKPLFILEVPQ